MQPSCGGVMAVLHMGCCPVLSPRAWCLGPLNLRIPFVLMRYFPPLQTPIPGLLSPGRGVGGRLSPLILSGGPRTAPVPRFWKHA